MPEDDVILCRTPTPGKQPVNLPRWKFDLVRTAMLATIPANDTGVTFKELPELVEDELSDEDRSRLGSLMWHVTTVKLELEVRGEIERVPGAKPQRLRRVARTTKGR